MNAQRRIVLTGVSRGLGRAMAWEFAARGHVVIGCARDASKTAALERELGQPHWLTALDVTDEP